MVYYAQDSAQFVAWKQLSDLGNPAAAFTTEALTLAAQYEAFRVWGEYVRRYGNIDKGRTKELIQVVIDGWTVLQVARRVGPGGKCASGTDVGAVDYQLARNKAKQEILEVLPQILEFDVARLLYQYDRFLNHRG